MPKRKSDLKKWQRNILRVWVFKSETETLKERRREQTSTCLLAKDALFHAGDNSEYTTRAAKTVKGARALLEAGFEYVIDMDGVKLFRKRM